MSTVDRILSLVWLTNWITVLFSQFQFTNLYLILFSWIFWSYCLSFECIVEIHLLNFSICRGPNLGNAFISLTLIVKAFVMFPSGKHFKRVYPKFVYFLVQLSSYWFLPIFSVFKTKMLISVVYCVSCIQIYM